MPTATRTALWPAAPAPITTTRAGGTPGTPPSSTPLPPLAICRAQAPNWMDSFPAIRDMGASSGRPPRASLTVS